MEIIKLKELAEQYRKVQMLDEVNWEDIDPIRDTLENKCFKINDKQEVRFIIGLMEKLFSYKFYDSRERDRVIDYSVDWGYMCFSPCSGGGLPKNYAENIFRSMNIEACYKEKIERYDYEKVKIRELEIYRGTDIELLINKMFKDGLI